ncbi:MAG TPA: flavin monoamine oxidase family protein [Thermomicrobiales bacterium]|nr:flavin monoamine oxidase family protein [Thermomicrobiales bacterium]
MDQSANPRGNAVRQPGTLSRRRFLQMVAMTSGSAAMLNVMAAWGQQETGGQTAPPPLQGSGQGTKVIVIGVGSGGSVAAYELMKHGYDVYIVEARDRVGGHAFTVRGGSESEEYGKGKQTCDWPEGLWYDAGPSRVPFYHRGFYHYCSEFNIPLIDYNNINLNAYVYAEDIQGSFNGQKMRLHEMQADMAGYTSQYLASALDQGALDEEVTGEDAEMLRNYLINWGILDASTMKYMKTEHRGYTVLPDTQSNGEIAPPPEFSELIPFAAAAMRAQGGYLASTPTFDWQSTLTSTKEGVGQLYEEGFRKAFGDALHLNCEVTEINQSEDGVTVIYHNKETGQDESVDGDYVMCNIPLSVLIKMKIDVSQDFMAAMRRVPYAMALRLGLGFKRRFWEEDDWIYGGQSFTNIPHLGIIGYPNGDYLDKRGGALLGTYVFDLQAAYVSSLAFEDRIALALKEGSKVHPQMQDEFISGFSVAWHQEPYSLGAWPDYNPQLRAEVMPTLQEPDGRIYLVGEHLSYVNAWMEGAVQAAWMQVEKLHTRVMQG